MAALIASAIGVFTVKKVQVIGTDLPREKIVQASDVVGHNIFRVRADGVIDRLQSVPDIVVEQVETSFPDQVTIHARLREAMVAWQRGNAIFLLDSAGRVIKQVPKTDLPVIVGEDRHGAFGPGVVQAVRYAVRALPNAPSGAIAGFRVVPASGLTIVGKSGWRAVAGQGSARVLVARVAFLEALLRKLGPRAEQLAIIDVRNRQGAVTWK
jgi:hypothetical protein